MDIASLSLSNDDAPLKSIDDAPPKRWTYDVFVNFQGEDTQSNFVDHLYAALDREGIYVYKDDDKLLRGKPVSPELMKVIEESIIAVVVFSKNYANSVWCLEELAKILECRDLIRQRVLPVFYDVGRLNVRGLEGCFQAAFEGHEVKYIDDMEKVKRWKEAVVTVANLSGWDVPATATGHEAEWIKQMIWNILSCTQSHPADNLIGMDSRVRHVKSLLGEGSGDVCIIGICGTGGIGKTTIARAVYHQLMHKFEGSSFLEDVRVIGSSTRGLKSLQEKLLLEILMEDDYKLSDCNDGVRHIQRILSSMKVLLVLDDVDNIKQLESLAGAREWFGSGSRIIITTRDEHLLSYAQKKYTPALLEESDASKLFSRYAFKANIPPKAYEELSRAVVSHTGHLPLALIVLGSHMFGRNVDFWLSALSVLNEMPRKDINGILKLSFDGLNILEKKILLHIACFFKGKQRSYVTRILDSCGFEAVSGVTVLIQKSLLTILNGNLHMHDLIQEMARSIVREFYPNTMVWLTKEIKGITLAIERSEVVEAIVESEYDVFIGRPIPCCSAKVFKSMKKLRLLEINKDFTSNEPTYFPEELRWLSWSDYPFPTLRITRAMTKLVGIDLTYSDIQQLQFEKKVVLNNLKCVDLNRSYLITSFPDVSGVPNLERLILRSCMRLVEVHQSVFLHDKITHLDLTGCSCLQYLPSPIKMKSLQALILFTCENLKRLPEVSMEMERLLVLNIGWCDRIKSLPSSFALFTGLTILEMGVIDVSLVAKKHKQGYSKRILPNTRHSSLRILDLKKNHLVDTDFPSDVHIIWPSMEQLNLSWNNFTRLPATVSLLSHLKHLDLSECVFLKELPELPSLIQVLKADGCRSLEKIDDLCNKYKWLFKISLRGTSKLLTDQESVNRFANMLMKSVVQKCAAVNHRLSVAVPGSKIPDWFSNQSLGNKISLKLPQNQINKLKGVAMCCLYCLPTIDTCEFVRITFKSSGEEKLIDTQAVGTKRADHLWMGYLSMDFLGKLSHGFESEDLIISFDVDYNKMRECGVCLVYEDDIKPVAGNGSWVLDYDELGRGLHDNATSEDLQQERRSLPSFWFGNERTGHQNTVYVNF